MRHQGLFKVLTCFLPGRSIGVYGPEHRRSSFLMYTNKSIAYVQQTSQDETYNVMAALIDFL